MSSRFITHNIVFGIFNLISIANRKRKEIIVHTQSVTVIFYPFFYFCQMFLLRANLLDKLEQLDQWLFIQVNNHQSNSFFDAIMPYLRVAYTWTPIYIFVIVFIISNFKSRGLWWLVLFLCTVSLCDMTSTNLFKNLVQRPRPCYDLDFFQHVRLVVDSCGGKYGFTSNHAANHFGMATFIFITLHSILGKWRWIVWVWAALIGYAQVYVGVHYPFDILGGALIGLSFGALLGTFFNKRFGFVNFDALPTGTH
jgi:undecaprenyl-diphosphatase